MNKVVIILWVIIMLFFIGIPVTETIIKYTNEEEIIIMVKDKFIKNYNESGIYLIVDNNNNTYCIQDLFLKGKFNSTDLYNQLELNKTYKIKTSGYRIQFLSMYKNINEILEEK